MWYYDSGTGWTVALSGLSGAAGITGEKERGGRVYVSAFLGGEVVVAAEEGGRLVEVQRVRVGFMGRGLALTGTGDVYVAGFMRPVEGRGTVVARVSTRQVGGGFFGEGGYTGEVMVEEVFVDVEGRWVDGGVKAVFRERVVGVEVEVEVGGEDEEGYEVEEEVVEKEVGGVGDLYVMGLEGRGELSGVLGLGSFVTDWYAAGILKCRDFK